VDDPARGATLKSGRLFTAGLDAYESKPRVPQKLIDLAHVMLSTQIAPAPFTPATP